MHKNSTEKKLHNQKRGSVANSRAGGRTRETHSSPSSSRSLEHAASLTLDGALAPQHHAEKIAPIRHG
jgi:hypothetical protein